MTTPLAAWNDLLCAVEVATDSHKYDIGQAILDGNIERIGDQVMRLLEDYYQLNDERARG